MGGHYPPPFPPTPGFHQGGPPPPGFFPNQTQFGRMQGRPPFRPDHRFRPPPNAQFDPLSDAPHETFQGREFAHRNRPPPPPASAGLPQNPMLAGAAPAASSTPPLAAAPTISAAPVLRDFRRESAAFVPAAVKRKAKAAALNAPKVDAAPDRDATGPVREVGEVVPKRARIEESALMGSLKGVLAGSAVGAAAAVQQAAEKKKKEDKDGYDSFLSGLGGF